MSINVSAVLRARELEIEKSHLLEIRRLRQENGIEFYRPHLKQHRFHSCSLTGRYCRTGNRFGKSQMGICEDISWALGGRLWYRYAFDILNGDGSVALTHLGGTHHPFVTSGIPQRPVKGLILVVDWDKAKEVFTNREGSYDVWGKFWQMVPKDVVGKVSNGGRGDRIVKVEIKRPAEFGGGSSTISFDTVESYKHNKMGAESDNWDFIHVDEPVPEKLFKAHQRGLIDRGGSFWFTCTPLDEMWINDWFTPPGKQRIERCDEGFAFATKTHNNRFIITGSTRDNPFQKEENIVEFESGLNIEEKSARIEGIPSAFSGLIYREFQYDLHVLQKVPKDWLDFNNPPKSYTIRIAWDVHDSKPQAILYAATAPTGEVFIYDEQFFDRVIGVNAETLKERIAGRQVIDYIIDPRAVIESPVTDESILDELMKYDLWFEKASKDLTLGISKVREKLKERLPNDAPTIYFSPQLTETLFEFQHYVYKDGKVKDEHDHMMENLYRLILNGLDYVLPENDEFVARPLRISHNELEFSRGFKPSLKRPVSRRDSFSDDSESSLNFFP